MARRVPFSWKRGCFMRSKIIFLHEACEVGLNPHEVRLNIKMNIEPNMRRKHGPDGRGCIGSKGGGGGAWGPE